MAALAGRVAYVKSNCGVGDEACGGWFGNQVRVDHGGGYYTIYAHLSSVEVTVGDKVGRGQMIGHEGNTGKSTADHLHFSLHQGDAKEDKVSSSVSYTIRNKDVTDGGAFADRQASAHTCGAQGQGHVYMSNNACQKDYDDKLDAKQITNNTTYLGETCAVGDEDYFRFSGGGGPFTATVTSTSESISDCSCAILNAQGQELQPAGAEGYFRNDGYNGAEGCACSLANAPATTYFLKIYADMPGEYRFEKKLPR